MVAVAIMVSIVVPVSVIVVAVSIMVSMMVPVSVIVIIIIVISVIVVAMAPGRVGLVEVMPGIEASASMAVATGEGDIYSRTIVEHSVDCVTGVDAESPATGAP